MTKYRATDVIGDFVPPGAYDFVESRTHNGRKFRMLNILDEFARECLAIRIEREAQLDRRHRRLFGPAHPTRRARPRSF